jgi:hypothetical protein
MSIDRIVHHTFVVLLCSKAAEAQGKLLGVIQLLLLMHIVDIAATTAGGDDPYRSFKYNKLKVFNGTQSVST